jgi:dihydroorotate dehydrogenase electron transfer subunit
MTPTIVTNDARAARIVPLRRRGFAAVRRTACYSRDGMLDVRAKVLAVDEHPLPYFTISLGLPSDYPAVSPGQFVMVQIGSGLEPYLRRAFSVYDLVTSEQAAVEIRLLGKVIGRGTRALGSARPGQEMRVLGPLGRGFALRSARRVALVAGGVGSAALLLLARTLAPTTRFDVLYGGRGHLDLPDAALFGRLAQRSGGELIVTTEDGSVGRRGLVTAPLEERLTRGSYDYLYACGPMGLLAKLAALCAEHDVAGEAALETPMGCGYGACLGCAVPHVAGHYALCCKDGPVFAFDEVSW